MNRMKLEWWCLLFLTLFFALYSSFVLGSVTIYWLIERRVEAKEKEMQKKLDDAEREYRQQRR